MELGNLILGKALDNLGWLLGIKRRFFEFDRAYRLRLKAAVVPLGTDVLLSGTRKKKMTHTIMELSFEGQVYRATIRADGTLAALEDFSGMDLFPYLTTQQRRHFVRKVISHRGILTAAAVKARVKA